ncbi:hypothetical protein [Flavobacterium beibuense]|uniref:hypothetical protein n=1 Tax=Flavobacterium beibuense TaxID=657326 RepID=UPI003A94600B
MLAEEASYCYVCNTNQTEGFEHFEIKPQQSDLFLKILCVLTIIGAGFTLITSFISLITSPYLTSDIDFGYPVTPVIISNVLIAGGKILGAVFMLQKKLKGLYIYTVAAVISELLSIYTAVSILQNFDFAYMLISAGIGLFLGLLILVLYWLPINRKLLS